MRSWVDLGWGFLLGICLGSSAWAKSPDLKPGEVLLCVDAPRQFPVGNHFTLPRSCTAPGEVQLRLPKVFPRRWRTPFRKTSSAKTALSRTMIVPSDFDPGELKDASFLLPNLEGFSEMRISGSAQFTVPELKKVLEYLKESLEQQKILLIDLRQESHGFVSDLPVSWYALYNTVNLDKSLPEIEDSEKFRLEELRGQKKLQVRSFGNSEPQGREIELSLPEKSVAVRSEKDWVQELEVSYLRIPVADYHRPKDEEVDRFVQLFRKLDQDQWVHFHCAAGAGRTTTFMAMADMMRNSQNVSFQDILQRQKILGGIDLSEIVKMDPVRKGWAEDRAAFVQEFYEYCKSEIPDFRNSWSTWKTLRSQIKSKTVKSEIKKFRKSV